MSNHFLTRGEGNEPVCGGCGFRPAVLDDFRPWHHRFRKAKIAVLDHAKTFNDFEATLKAAAQPDTVIPLRSPQDPFHSRHERRFPRAGVRQGDAGKWIITLWDEEGVVHVWENQDNAEHHNRLDAFDFAQWFIKCHRDAGVRLNGRDVA